MPVLFSWYHLQLTGGYTGGLYLTAFGNSISDPSGLDLEMAMLVLIGGILVLVGAALCIFGAFTEKKPLGIIGGLVMIVGPLLLVMDLLLVISEFAEFMDTNWADPLNKSIFFGTESGGGTTAVWGLWIGFYMAIAGGVLGLIGGASV
ncbi:MAG: hypothetical protein ACFE9T_02865 [Promethearchaeota archaeon]